MSADLKKQIEAALLRTDLTEEQKKALKDGLAVVEQYGTNFRKVIEVRRNLIPIIGRGGFPGAMAGAFRGPAGGQLAEAGVYAVKLTVGGKTYSGKVSVRLDPIQAAQSN